MPRSISESLPPAALADAVKERARGEGFSAVGITPAASAPGTREALEAYLSRGHHGDMTWMARTAHRRADPARLWSAAKSAIVMGVNYAPAADPLASLNRPQRGVISVYAQGNDYHDVLLRRLKRVASWLVSTYGGEAKVFVDTAPVMEKPLAQKAGLGWQGKHTNLVSRSFGSWLFLGSIFTTLALPGDAPDTDHCGRCRRCLAVCPTGAFPAPYEIDARRCISYLTIEHKGHIAREFRPAIGNRIYGCDDCLAVCPWNKFAQTAHEAAFVRRNLRDDLAALAALDDAAFRAQFAKSPIKRIGRDRFVRNVLIAIGNSGTKQLADSAIGLLDDPSPLVRSMAIWALKRLLSPETFAHLAQRRAAAENDADVAAEWLNP